MIVTSSTRVVLIIYVRFLLFALAGRTYFLATLGESQVVKVYIDNKNYNVLWKYNNKPLPQKALNPVSGNFKQREDGTVKFQRRNIFSEIDFSVSNQSPHRETNRLEDVFDFSSVFSSSECMAYAYIKSGYRRDNKVYYRPILRQPRRGNQREVRHTTLQRINEYGYAKVDNQVIQLYVDGVTKAVKWAEINGVPHNDLKFPQDHYYSMDRYGHIQFITKEDTIKYPDRSIFYPFDYSTILENAVIERESRYETLNDDHRLVRILTSTNVAPKGYQMLEKLAHPPCKDFQDFEDYYLTAANPDAHAREPQYYCKNERKTTINRGKLRTVIGAHLTKIF
jgi:hypothetical protein